MSQEVLGAIQIRGARTNNLKGINVDIPYYTLVALTGLSGSGKTSLGFGTLFAEGSRRYIESFSAHTRQFLEKIPKPPVDAITGVLPSIGLSKKGTVENVRARVGTLTNIFSYIRLLYARLGETYSPISGKKVKRESVSDVIDYIEKNGEGKKIMLLAPLLFSAEKTWEKTLQTLLIKGFTRLWEKGKLVWIEELLRNTQKPSHEAMLLIDRLKVDSAKKLQSSKVRLADSAKTAFFEGHGSCIVNINNKVQRTFSDRFEADGKQFIVPTPHLFSFNSPHGSCQACKGLGKNFDIDESKVIPNPALSVASGAVAPWKSAFFTKWQNSSMLLQQLGFPVDTPYQGLLPAHQKLLWEGAGAFKGIKAFFVWIRTKRHKVQYRILDAQYRGIVPCKSCEGTGLREDVRYIKIGGKSVFELLKMTIAELTTFFNALQFPAHQQKVATILLEEINKRLYYLGKVGLSYLTLNRRVKTLSGGEYQRVRLAKILGSPLVDNLYMMDEPTTGLHPRDIDKLVSVLCDLRDLGNTIVVVGHDELVMRAADKIVDLGPGAGIHGGQITFEGTWKTLPQAQKSYTADYLLGHKQIPVPVRKPLSSKQLILKNAYSHNLHNLEVCFPLGRFIAITGVSGSGKSTLIHDILFPLLSAQLQKVTNRNTKTQGELTGDIAVIQDVIYMSQHAMRRSSRSNLATYLHLYDCVRYLFTQTSLAQERGYQVGHFSFNSPAGRCEICAGEGVIKVDMQFMEDVVLTCENCEGQRFQKEILEVRFNGKNIIDVLNMTVIEAISFFSAYPTIVHKLTPLVTVGLDFLTLGRPCNTFSSGEAQRVKLATYLNPEHIVGHTFFIFDEPTVGLHFHDVHKLLKAFRALVAQGHTVLTIEHHLDVIKSADWVIDLGPEGGDKGGQVVFSGTPEALAKQSNNHTATYLRQKMMRDLVRAQANSSP